MPPKPITENTLFYGDNLAILREYFPDESVDLVYLDPLFNSNRASGDLFADESSEARDVRNVGNLHGTVDREGAAIGVFITLEPPSAPMLTEAVSAGYHSPGWSRDYPRIQLLTIDDLLCGKKIDMPPEHGTFKQAPKAEQTGKQHELGF